MYAFLVCSVILILYYLLINKNLFMYYKTTFLSAGGSPHLHLKSITSRSCRSRSSSPNVDVLPYRASSETPASSWGAYDVVKKEQQWNPIEIDPVKESHVTTTASVQGELVEIWIFYIEVVNKGVRRIFVRVEGQWYLLLA